ncbi:MAG TPA: glycerophosphodiester phosphodiesterase family protein [Nonomuraea sp.]|nr:glycerophosphodiester phosphodiesterase family protein [Nonomuraea sp.]
MTEVDRLGPRRRDALLIIRTASTARVGLPVGPRARLSLRGPGPRGARYVLHVGHRGAGAHAPENTLMAIRKAADLGAHMVELDVRMSADGVAVLSHNAEVEMPERGRVPLHALTVVEAQRSRSTQETSVPTLAAALDLCQELHLGPYLEIKEAESVPQVVAALVARAAWVGTA